MDQKLLFRYHIDQAIKKAIKCVRCIYAMMNRNSRLFADKKILLHKQLDQSCFISPSWYDCATTHLNRLQIYQNRILKMFMNLPFRHSTTDVQKRAGVELIGDFIKRLTEGFRQKSCDSSYLLILSLYDD